MAEEDLKLFLRKVEHLTKMVDSLESIPGRRDLLVQCNTHEEVINLAKSWGYDIGRRWGDPK